MTMPMIHRTAIQVENKSYITPHYLRIQFLCTAIAPYLDLPVGVNNKLFFPHPTDQNSSVMRTYTHRAIDPDKGLMTIDFALHEGESVACQWAKEAEKGDEIEVAMKLQHRPLVPEVDHYLFVTDMSGIAPTAAIVERLPKGVKATIITELLSEQDRYNFYQSEATLECHWYINPSPDQGSRLSEFVLAIPQVETIEGSRFAHIVAEFNTVRTLRGQLHRQRQWGRDEIYACAYWQIGKEESAPREKRIE